MTGSTSVTIRRNQLMVALAGLIVLVASGAIAHGGKVGAIERRGFRAINDLPGSLYGVLWPFQQFGNLVVAVVLGLVVALILRNWRLAVAVVAATVLKLGVEKAIKQVVERQRPGTTIGDIHRHGDVPLHGLSFVSGHAVITAAIAGLIAPALPHRLRLVPWVLVVLNGVARIYVGAHNPLDIVGGIAAGLLIAGVLNAALLPARTHTRSEGAKRADSTS